MEPGPSAETSIPLSVENVLWANTVLAAGSAVGLVTYTGKETRAVLNTSEPETKMGTLEQEVNKMAKVSKSSRLQLVCIADTCLTDSMHCYILVVGPIGRVERVQGKMVHLCRSIFDPILVHHPNFVSGDVEGSIQC